MDYSFLEPEFEPYHISPACVDWSHLFSRPPPDVQAAGGMSFDPYVRSSERGPGCSKVEAVIGTLASRPTDDYGLQYVRDLLRSLQYLRSTKKKEFTLRENREEFEQRLSVEVVQQRVSNAELLRTIRNAFLHNESIAQKVSHRAGIWPDVSTLSLLSHLSTNGKRFVEIPISWKDVFVQLVLSITSLQKYERLFACFHNVSELFKEIDNPGHWGWNPFQHPGWLLFEIENNILIRPVQARIAKENDRPIVWKNRDCATQHGRG